MWASTPTSQSVSQLVKSFKILVTKQAGFSIWQRSFYDHIIRDECDYLEIWQYIDENPIKWGEIAFMKGNITVKYLQNYIKLKDFNPELKKDYFLKLSEEVGELSRAMRKNMRPADETQIKETVEEEIWDVVYYALAIANCYEIDVEKVIPIKEKLNNEKYNTGIAFNPNE